MKRSLQLCSLVSFTSLALLTSAGADWPRFRGPDGSGTSADKDLPVEWGPDKNIVWKTELPGWGTSSPITSGDKVFVTCFSGYGLSTGRGNQGEQKDLKRHLVCCERSTGKILWDKPIAARLPEDRAGGQLNEHGYASHTPATDGKRVYVMFGKTGVIAFDMQGEEVWRADVGQGSAVNGWGSAASPILYKNTLIVNASPEKQQLFALDVETGKEVWKANIGNNGTWSTPILVDAGKDVQDLVMSASNELWGLNPDSGKLRWYVSAFSGGFGNTAPSPVAHDGIIYAINAGPRGSGAGIVAVKPGGEKDATKSHVQWTGNVGSYSTSPVYSNGHLFWVNDEGYAFCVDAKTGKTAYSKKRLDPSAGKVYSSLLAADGKLYLVSCNNGAFVLDATPEFKQLAHNDLSKIDNSVFNASPSVSNGQLLLRSNKYLYCIGKK